MKNIKNMFDNIHKELLKWITLGQIQTAAIKLGIYQNKKIVFKNKNEEKAFYDFNIYEEALDNNRVIDNFLNEYQIKSTSEKLLLEAMKNSYLSLFLIRKINKSDMTLLADDLINKNNNLTLINFDNTPAYEAKNLLFTRIINYRDDKIISGLTLVFRMRNKRQLLKEWDKKSILESDSTHRFINFFHLHRNIGLYK